MNAPPADARAERQRRWEDWLASSHEVALQVELPIVDPHHHLWDRGGHTYLPAQFAADAAGHRLVASVYVECLSHYCADGPRHLQPVGETLYVADLARAHAREAGSAIAAGIVAHADLALGESVGEVLDAHAQAADGRLRGVRYTTACDDDSTIHSAYTTHAGMLCELAVHDGAQQLARRGLVLDLWMYFHQLGEVLALARACPGLAIVIDHAGGPIGMGRYANQRAEVFAAWRLALQPLRHVDNVSLKFGGLAMPLAGFDWRKRPVPPHSQELALAWQPYFDVCLETFGAQRCMFESNFPVDRSGCTYTSLWNAFKRLAAPLSSDERLALLGGTAQRVYRL